MRTEPKLQYTTMQLQCESQRRHQTTTAGGRANLLASMFNAAMQCNTIHMCHRFIMYI